MKKLILIICLALGTTGLAETPPAEWPENDWYKFFEASASIVAGEIYSRAAVFPEGVGGKFPLVDVYSALSAIGSATNPGLLSWLKNKMVEASIDGDMGRLDTYQAYYTCLASQDCSRLSAIQQATQAFLDTSVNQQANGVSSIVSTFEDGSMDGWTLYLGELSNTSGYLETYPPGEGATSYYVAPPSFHGDWSSFSTLSFDLLSKGGSYYDGYSYSGYDDIYITNGGMTAQRSFPNPHDGSWQTYNIPLYDDGSWTLGGGATSFLDILTNVTEFQIRAEYGAGNDSSSLDNVSLSY